MISRINYVHFIIQGQNNTQMIWKWFLWKICFTIFSDQCFWNYEVWKVIL